MRRSLLLAALFVALPAAAQSQARPLTPQERAAIAPTIRNLIGRDADVAIATAAADLDATVARRLSPMSPAAMSAAVAGAISWC